MEKKYNGVTYYINDETSNEFIDLVLNTESMDDDERQYWFDINPSMTEEQVDRFISILTEERNKLNELEIKYQKEIRKLNKKHLLEFKQK